MRTHKQPSIFDRALFGAGVTSFAVALGGTLWPLVA